MTDSEKLDLLLSKMENMEHRIELMEHRIYDLNTHIDGVDSKLADQKKQIDTMDSKLTHTILHIEDSMEKNAQLIAENFIELKNRNA
ncbi:MAG: hypothetical protein IJ567_11860 [Lachnospiraceae bacterium]|nr:hypothetical protein [Lachnospiraceae bacterium]